MPENKQYREAINSALAEMYGNTAEQSRLDGIRNSAETDKISLYQDYLSGKLQTNLKNDIENFKRENDILEEKLNLLTLEINSCDVQLRNQNIMFYFFNVCFVIMLVMILYKVLVLIKNRENV